MATYIRGRTDRPMRGHINERTGEIYPKYRSKKQQPKPGVVQKAMGTNNEREGFSYQYDDDGSLISARGPMAGMANVPLSRGGMGVSPKTFKIQQAMQSKGAKAVAKDDDSAAGKELKTLLGNTAGVLKQFQEQREAIMTSPQAKTLLMNKQPITQLTAGIDKQINDVGGVHQNLLKLYTGYLMEKAGETLSDDEVAQAASTIEAIYGAEGEAPLLTNRGGRKPSAVRKEGEVLTNLGGGRGWPEKEKPLGDSGASLPKPPKKGAVITDDYINVYLKAANNDPIAAQQMAEKAGWSL